jgi:hypothetical protein
MEMQDNKLKLFIGSSSNGLEVAEYLHAALVLHYEARVWNQGIFGLSQSSWESLVTASKQFDFAVFVLTPDDMNTKRDNVSATRDSILFQVGFFMRSLGRERTFIVYCEDDQIDLPRELADITPATFKRQESMRAAINPSSVAIREAIKNIGKKRSSREDIQNALRELSDHYIVVNDLKQIHHMLQNLESPVNVLVNWFESSSAPARRKEPLNIKFIRTIEGYWKPIHEQFTVIHFFASSLGDSRSMASGNVNVLTMLQALFKERDDFEAILKEPKSSGLYSLTMDISSDCSSLLTIIDVLMMRRFDQIDSIKGRLTRSINDE